MKISYYSIAIFILLFAVLLIIIRRVKMISPVQGKITSKFGDRIHPITKKKTFHNGIDVSAPQGTLVVAPLSGKVLKTWFDSAGGNSMQIEHDSGYITGYAHLQKILVKQGSYVKQGDEIGMVGSTGKSTGSHLHFTVRKLGQFINPLSLISI